MTDQPQLRLTRHALVVDDEPSVRTVLRRYLSKRGWMVTEAENGEEARALLAAPNEGRLPFDLIICDVRMPQLTGPELFAWTQGHRPDLIHRVLFASGDVFDPAIADFLRDCGAPTIEKPFEIAELSRLIESITSPHERAA